MSTDRWINKDVHKYNGMLLSHKKEQIWISGSDVDELRASYIEWSQSEGEKQISYINAYIQNLEKWYWWNYLQGRNGVADVVNGLVDTVREGEGGVDGESRIDIYTLSCVK